MSNIVEYIVKIRDLASGQWRSMAGNADNAFNRMNTRVKTTSSSVDQLNAKISALEKTRNMSINTSAVASANRQIDDLTRKRDRLENTGRIGGRMGGLFRQGLALAGVGGGAYMLKDIMQAGMERQMNLVAFQTLLGKNNGNQLNASLLDFAKKSIYGNEVFTEGKLMAGSGIKANNIMPVMRMIGDIAMGDKERMKSLALAFSEASTRGSLNGMNERMFLQGGLFNPLEQIHKMTGRSLADLKKDMSKGKISIDELVKSMEYATGPAGRWHNMMAKMQDTPAGKWTAFTGTIRTLAGTIGISLLPALGGITDFLAGIANSPDELYLIANAIGAMTAAWGLYSIAANWAAIQTFALEAAAMWPVALGATILGGLIALCSGNDGFASSTETTAQRISNAASLIRNSWTNTGYVIQTAWLGILSVGERVWNYMQAIANRKGAWKALTGDTEADIRLKKLKADHDAAKWAELDQKNGFVNIDPKTGKPVKTSSPLDAFKPTGYTPTGGGVPAGLADTAKGITGGGVRNQTINIARLGTDTISIYTNTLKEGKEQVQAMFEQLFNQVINSGNAAVSPQ